MLMGGDDIIGIGPRLADTGADQVQQARFGQFPCILDVVAVDCEGHGLHFAAVFQTHGMVAFDIDHGGLFARPQIIHHCVVITTGHAKGHAVAGAAIIQSQHQTGPLGRAAMDMRIDTERAVIAVERGHLLLDKLEARPPHQGPITENP